MSKQEASFHALVVREQNDGTFTRSVEERSLGDLPDHDVLVRVHYSGLNYKDGLSASGDKGVTQVFPNTPGVDAAGVVEASRDERFSEGDRVIVTSYDLGQNTPGGFGQYIRVPGDWIVPLPEGLTLKESMIYGSAGFTAAYGVHKIRHNGTLPEDGPVLVTGATGGVGSFAVALLSLEGYRVTAVTGKSGQGGFLEMLGAEEVAGRELVQDTSGKPLLSSTWAGVVDTVGGEMLDTAIRQARHNATVTCCGNILGGDLNTSIYPFILRGVSLLGIDSGICLMPMRRTLWNLMSDKWKLPQLEEMYREVGLDGLNVQIDRILEGGQVGKVLLNLKDG
ncbi:MAG: YhdH/YhfP family quinone oxidoreductase [Balneolaceae bacterium]|nr:YhdH/YhfP family quinone oxidoreductase [Balneolaceae bacterium]